MKQLIICITSLFILMEAHAQPTTADIEATVQLEVALAQCEVHRAANLSFGTLTSPRIGSATATMDPTLPADLTNESDDLVYTLDDQDNTPLDYSGQPWLGRFYVRALNAAQMIVELLSTPESLDWDECPPGDQCSIPYDPDWAYGDVYIGGFTRIDSDMDPVNLDDVAPDSTGYKSRYYRIGGSLSQITPELPTETYRGDILVQITCE